MLVLSLCFLVFKEIDALGSLKVRFLKNTSLRNFENSNDLEVRSAPPAAVTGLMAVLRSPRLNGQGFLWGLNPGLAPNKSYGFSEHALNMVWQGPAQKKPVRGQPGRTGTPRVPLESMAGKQRNGLEEGVERDNKETGDRKR